MILVQIALAGVHPSLPQTPQAFFLLQSDLTAPPPILVSMEASGVMQCAIVHISAKHPGLAEHKFQQHQVTGLGP